MLAHDNDDDIDPEGWAGLGTASAVRDVADMWIEQASRYRNLTADEEVRAAAGARVCACCRDGRQALVQHNLRLVPGIAKRWKLRGTSFEHTDLWQHGVEGLMKAAVKFDPARGRFTTCATWWIRQVMSRAVQESAHAVREPAYVHLERARAYKAGVEYPHRITPISLDTPVNPHMLATGSVMAEETYEARIADEDATDPQEAANESDSRDTLRAALSALLTPRQQAVISLRFLDGMTLERAGAELGITRERVRQIQKDALEKLRGSLILTGFDRFQSGVGMLHSQVPAAGSHPGDKGKVPKKRQRPAPSVASATTQNATRQPSPTVQQRNVSTRSALRSAPSQEASLASPPSAGQEAMRKQVTQSAEAAVTLPPRRQGNMERPSLTRGRRRSTSDGSVTKRVERKAIGNGR